MGRKGTVLWLAVFALVLLFSCQYSEAFKAEEFRKCHEASFCRRNRGKEPGVSTFALGGKLQQAPGGGLAGTLINKEFPGVELPLEISAYGNGIVRVKVTELPEKKRFEVPDVVDEGLDAKKSPIVSARSSKDTWLTLGENKLRILHDPFRVDAFVDGRPVLSINGRGLFNFEHYRERPANISEEESGSWEEVFKSHTDSKPKGPASVAFDAAFINAEQLYGIPERATRLPLKATKGMEGEESEPYRLFNLDVFEYLHESPFGLYGAVPMMMAHGKYGTAGLFFLNAAEMFIDVLAKAEHMIPGLEDKARIDTHWIAESGIFDVFLLLGPGPKQVVQQYTTVTGKPVMPQLFSIGYHQCRWNYKDEADVNAVDAGFDEHDIPYDVLWLDIEHTDHKKYFTWDHALFPHPKEMQERIARKGRKMVTIVDPHVKRDVGYYIHDEATAKGYYVKNKDGGDFEGWCWPGSSSYLDMLSPEVRDWWADQYSLEKYKESTLTLYSWNDMNEPSVFNGPELTMPRDNLHHNGVEHRDLHNLNGLLFHKASVEGLLKRANYNDRPFVLSRAFFAGTQRVGAIWTGDNTAEWEHLQVSVPMLLSLGVAGISFAGADVGGFFGNPEPDLLTRWYQVGAYYPFFRGHAHLDTKRREPWLFGEPYTTLIRDAIRTRYALLPYVYTVFYEAHKTGLLVMRPLWLEYPEQSATWALDESFLLGSDILVHPVVTKDATQVSVLFPGKEPWYDVRTGAVHSGAGGREATLPIAGLETFPAFQRGGSIIARKDRPRRSTTQMANDPYTLYIALNSTGSAEGVLYIDDGRSFDYEKGAYVLRRFTFQNGRLECSNAAPEGESAKGYSVASKIEKIVLMGLPKVGEKRSSFRAILGDTDGKIQLESAVEPPVMGSGGADKALVIKRPWLPVAEDWSIQIVSS